MTFSAKPRRRTALRGHQLGYRPKTNSYDAWDLRQWEQYYRDLIVFGANAVELIPPRSDDAATSPHFPLPPLEMMQGMSGLADKYGLDVWIWYPAMDRDYADPATVQFALKEWGDVFRQLAAHRRRVCPRRRSRPHAAGAPAGAAWKNRRRCCTARIPRRRCGSRRRASIKSGWTSFSRF